VSAEYAGGHSFVREELHRRPSESSRWPNNGDRSCPHRHDKRQCAIQSTANGAQHGYGHKTQPAFHLPNEIQRKLAQAKLCEQSFASQSFLLRMNFFLI